MDKLIELLETTVPGIDFRNEKELVTKGLLNSISIVSIIVMLQDEYNIELQLDEMSAENFESAEDIFQIIQKNTEVS